MGKTEALPETSLVLQKNLPRFPTNYIDMFEGPDFPKGLDEDVFNQWLENGRQSKLGYLYLIIIWDEYESEYHPVYVQQRNELNEYRSDKSSSRERLIAAYDLYSESRVL